MQTLGEYRVGVSFNPSNDAAVTRIKALAAELIDCINSVPLRIADQHGGETDHDRAGERGRCKAIAITGIEDAAMWAVKAATKGARS